MLFVAFCCLFRFLVRVFICRSMPFAALCCSFLFLKWNQFKNQNKKMPFVARYGFLLLVLGFCECFHLSIALLVVVFCWYENQNEQQKAKKSKWKPGFIGSCVK